MNPGPSLARRSNTLSSSLGLGEKLFLSSEERRFAHDIETALDSVEEGLLAEMSFTDDIADAASRYLLEAGGKRVRPTLTLLTAQLGAGANASVITAAIAVEITHLASLYHDDVMDEAQMRRGVPSAQTVWGNSVAILTGDLLFARASRLIASLGERALTIQTSTFERLCLGQLHETIGPREGEDPIEHYLQVLADKTGSLIAAAAEVGVVFSDAPNEYREPVQAFGERIGVAFQLVDDILDLSAAVRDDREAGGHRPPRRRADAAAALPAPGRRDRPCRRRTGGSARARGRGRRRPRALRRRRGRAARPRGDPCHAGRGAPLVG